MAVAVRTSWMAAIRARAACSSGPGRGQRTVTVRVSAHCQSPPGAAETVMR
jgi:hypothetical protein